MCASYGLDPRFTEQELVDSRDAEIIEELRLWAVMNAGETLRPTGKTLRNLNPLLIPTDSGAPELIQGWWGFLVDGEPAKFPSINTRSERLTQRPGELTHRAIVPATEWFEMQKPERLWHEFLVDAGALFGMAAVTQRGRTADGQTFVCSSLIMRPAPESLIAVHERMPLLIPADFARHWLTAEPSANLIDEALAEAATLDDRVSVAPRRP